MITKSSYLQSRQCLERAWLAARGVEYQPVPSQYRAQYRARYLPHRPRAQSARCPSVDQGERSWAAILVARGAKVGSLRSSRLWKWYARSSALREWEVRRPISFQLWPPRSRRRATRRQSQMRSSACSGRTHKGDSVRALSRWASRSSAVTLGRSARYSRRAGLCAASRQRPSQVRDRSSIGTDPTRRVGRGSDLQPRLSFQVNQRAYRFRIQRSASHSSPQGLRACKWKWVASTE